MVPLPKWVWVGGVSLSAVAGLINGICFMGLSHQVVSHLTGSTSLLGLAIAQGDWGSMVFLWSILIAFCAGATLSGLLINDSALQLGQRYGQVLMIEGALIVACVPLLERGSGWGIALAAMACGLQNAMATTYSGSLLRTTHLTGMFTDLGIGLGQLLRGRPLPYRRLTLSGMVITSFLCGSIGGGLLFVPLHYAALYLPAAIVGLTGVAYLLYGARLKARSGHTPPAE